MSACLFLFCLSCAYQIVVTLLAVVFSLRKAKSSDQGQRFSQIKPLRSAEESSLQNLSAFIETTRGREHDFYICTPESGPEDWLKRHPEVTWLKLNARPVSYTHLTLPTKA